ncbi:hypothetical protein [Bacillus paranthracis]|uniref:hypothetical protein n=1 Tax=Bacillus cereus group sp. Bce015 TaxID=3445249 RepID=UPI0014446928|nr:hypothetical protein [Bacillus paranthracis]
MQFHVHLLLLSIVAFLSYLIPLKRIQLPYKSNQVQVALIDEMISTFRQGTSAYQQTTRNRKPSQNMYRDGLLLFIYPLLR